MRDQPIGGDIVSYEAGGRQHIAVAAGLKLPIWPVNTTTARIVIFGMGSEHNCRGGPQARPYFQLIGAPLLDRREDDVVDELAVVQTLRNHLPGVVQRHDTLDLPRAVARIDQRGEVGHRAVLIEEHAVLAARG